MQKITKQLETFASLDDFPKSGGMRQDGCWMSSALPQYEEARTQQGLRVSISFVMRPLPCLYDKFCYQLKNDQYHYFQYFFDMPNVGLEVEFGMIAMSRGVCDIIIIHQ